MDNIVPHLSWIKDWWHVIVGVVLAVVWAMIRLLKTVFITNEQLRRYHEENALAHRRIEEKIERKFDRIIGILLGKTNE